MDEGVSGQIDRWMDGGWVGMRLERGGMGELVDG